MSTLNISVVRNAVTGRYVKNELLEEGTFAEAMVVPEKDVGDLVEILQEIWETNLAYSQQYIGRVPPVPIELQAVTFPIGEPSFEGAADVGEAMQELDEATNE